LAIGNRDHKNSQRSDKTMEMIPKRGLLGKKKKELGIEK
jgi:hypothetical protein